MAQNIIRTGNYFLVGLGIGSLVGVLFAPKSGGGNSELYGEENKGRK
jgi:gas vesicle protein